MNNSQNKRPYLPRFLGQLGCYAQGVVVIVDVMIASLASNANWAFGFFGRFDSSDGTRFFPFEIFGDELEAALGNAFSVARFTVNIWRPEQEKPAQTVRPVSFPKKYWMNIHTNVIKENQKKNKTNKKLSKQVWSFSFLEVSSLCQTHTHTLATRVQESWTNRSGLKTCHIQFNPLRKS